MKNNKTNSDILDDNFFPEEKKPISSYDFLKIIKYTFLNSITFLLLVILFAHVIFPFLFSFHFGSGRSEIYYIFLIAFSPFIFNFFRQIRNKNLFNVNWKIWVTILSFISFFIISFIALLVHLFKSGF